MHFASVGNLKEEFIYAMVNFNMPHRAMLPHLPEDTAGKLGKNIGFDTKKTLCEIIKVSFESVGYEGVGRMGISYAARHLPRHTQYLAKNLEPVSRIRNSPVNYIAGGLIKAYGISLSRSKYNNTSR